MSEASSLLFELPINKLKSSNSDEMVAKSDEKMNFSYLSVYCNQTFTTRPLVEECIHPSMKLTQTTLITVTIYSIIFVISSIANLILMFILVKKRGKETSRINRFMFHLNVADLIITFVTIPLEIGWKSTVDWRIGDLGCKFFQFCRPFGIYLTSFIIIALSIDRYFAIVYPLKIKYVHQRTRILIYSSWILSIICSLPQVSALIIKRVLLF